MLFLFFNMFLFSLCHVACSDCNLNLSYRLLQFARSKEAEKKIRVSRQPVPECLLPPGCSAALYDVKIHGKGPDDEIYRKDEKIRLMVGVKGGVRGLTECVTIFIKLKNIATALAHDNGKFLLSSCSCVLQLFTIPQVI